MIHLLPSDVCKNTIINLYLHENALGVGPQYIQKVRLVYVCVFLIDRTKPFSNGPNVEVFCNQIYSIDETFLHLGSTRNQPPPPPPPTSPSTLSSP